MEKLKATLRYYGVSPWEIEVVYGFLNSHFEVIQDEIEPDDPAFVSLLEVRIPLEFNAGFFEWFTFKRWEKVKGILKEMKRRRGSGNAIRVRLVFAGSPRIIFAIDSEDRQWFNNAIEKIDFVLELLPYHLDPASLPPGTAELTYMFDPDTARWRQDAASGEREYVFEGGAWRAT